MCQPANKYIYENQDAVRKRKTILYRSLKLVIYPARILAQLTVQFSVGGNVSNTQHRPKEDTKCHKGQSSDFLGVGAMVFPVITISGVVNGF